MHSAPSDRLVDDVCRAGNLIKPVHLTRLSGGRTNWVWKITDATKSVTLKLYTKNPQNDLFPNDPEAERMCLQHLAGTGLAPDFIASGTTGSDTWALYSYVEGQTWNRKSGQVGTYLRALHQQPKPSGLRAAPNGSAAIVQQSRYLLSLCNGESALDLANAAPDAPPVPPAETALIHGDPVPGNLLVAGDRLCFIDWQCPAIGDPCSDLAIFLSPAMQQLYRGTPLGTDEVSECLAAYGCPSIVARYHQLRPWFHWRMASYCVWRTQQGDIEYAQGFELERAALLSLAA